MPKKSPKYLSQKQPTFKLALLVSSGLALIALLSLMLLTPKTRSWGGKTQTVASKTSQKPTNQPKEPPSKVMTLVSKPPEQRQSQLEDLAKSAKEPIERSRARYLLASDLIEQKQGKPALSLLQNLEKDYPILGANIMLQRAKAYELIDEDAKAQQTRQKLLENYSNSPVAVEAFYLLGKSNPEFWENTISSNSSKKASLVLDLSNSKTSEQKLEFLNQFPTHPRTLEIARQLLKENPSSFDLLLLLGKHDRDTSSDEIRDRLVKQHARELSATDWEAIASIYWERKEYGKAANAYARAPHTPHNTYRLARGLHISGHKIEAKKIYKKYIEKFPDAEDMGLALRHLVRLSEAQEALKYLDLAIAKFPDQAAEAISEKANLLDALKSSQAASEARKLLLSKYADSEAAANYRWDIAQKLASSGDRSTAWQWIRSLMEHNPNSSVTAKAVFWGGKWAQQLGESQDAKTAFEYILTHQPQSYYAWRSAVMLGWNVGDFTTVRQMSPSAIAPTTRPLPPAGSDSFKELYRLGQDGDARSLFAAQTGKEEELTVAEQFTDGLIKLALGNNLKGINQIGALKEREEPQQQSEWQSLRQTPEYWQALFPFPYENIVFDWAKERELNPFLVTALIRQESRFEPEIKSFAGAVGLMQLMPGTGHWVAQTIKLKDYSLTNPNDNINMGTWYLKHTHEIYNDNSLLAVASYNAGPGNVAKWIKKYNFKDPDVFVENIPFSETKHYVEAVFSNYWNYLRTYNPQVSQLLSGYTKTQG